MHCEGESRWEVVTSRWEVVVSDGRWWVMGCRVPI